MRDPYAGAEVGTALIAHPSAELYGSDRVMLETISGLVEANWRVVLTVPTDGPLLIEARVRGAETVIVRTPVLRKSALSPDGLARLSAAALAQSMPALRLLRRLRPDVLYVSTLTIPLWSLLASTRGIPIVSHVHEAERSARRPLRRALATPLLLADRVIANSRFSLDVLMNDMSRLKSRTSVVYNGVAGPEVLTLPRLTLDGPLNVVYVGRLSPRKGVDVAVEAIGSLAAAGVPVQLDIVGAVFEGYEWYEKQLRDRIGELGIEQSVRFHGFVDTAWEQVSAADVVVVPSRTDEPFGNTAVEAVLAARPSVVSASGGLPEAVQGFASSLLVAPGDSNELAAALQTIAKQWEQFRTQAIVDSAEATRRYGPDIYRANIAEEIADVAFAQRLAQTIAAANAELESVR